MVERFSMKDVLLLMCQTYLRGKIESVYGDRAARRRARKILRILNLCLYKHTHVNRSFTVSDYHRENFPSSKQSCDGGNSQILWASAQGGNSQCKTHYSTVRSRILQQNFIKIFQFISKCLKN